MPFLTDLATHIKTWAGGKFLLAHTIASGTLSTLTIDLATNNIFNISLSANATFSVSNPSTKRDYYFYVKNTGASTITITLPSSADMWESSTTPISTGKTKAFAMQWNGTKRIWQISAELT